MAPGRGMMAQHDDARCCPTAGRDNHYLTQYHLARVLEGQAVTAESAVPL